MDTYAGGAAAGMTGAQVAATQALVSGAWNPVPDQARSATAATAAIAAGAASQITEDWTNLSAWAYTATKLQVSGNRLYSQNPGGGTNGANRAFTVGPTETARLLYVVHIPSFGGTAGGVMVGVNSDTAGAVPTGGAATAFAMYFHGEAALVEQYNNGVSSTPTNSTSSAGIYLVAVTIDLLYISITARKTDGTGELFIRRARSGFTVNNQFVFNSDTRTTGGLSVGLVSAHKSLATIGNRNFGEGLAPTGQWTGDGTNDLTVTLPANYNSTTAAPVMVMFHGSGSSAWMWWNNAVQVELARALLADGWIIVGANAASTTTWGSARCIAAYLAAYRYARDNYRIGPVAFYGVSMGGIESMNTLSAMVIPGVRGLMLTVPSYSLANIYSLAAFTSAIDTEYATGGTALGYANTTKGYDPALKPGAGLSAAPVWMFVATDDATLPPASNGLALAADLSGYSACTLVTGTGGHNASLSPYLTQMVAAAAAWKT